MRIVNWVLAAALCSPPLAIAADNQLTPAEKAAGWRLLFDGKTYANWVVPGEKSPPGDSFTIEDGCLKAAPHPKIVEDLFTKTSSPISNWNGIGRFRRAETAA